MELKKRLLTLAVSLVAVFADPFGYKLVLYPFDLLFRQQSLVRYVGKWQPVDFSTHNRTLARWV